MTVQPPRADQRPHIIFITTDTQGREMLSAYVNRPGVETPQLDRLAADGMLFENAITASPLCTPARAAWFTGRHPNRSGAWANDLTVGRHVPMLAEALTGAGYDALHVGKWHLDGGGYTGRGRGDGGFDDAAWYDLSNFYDDVGREGVNQFGGWNRGLHDEQFCFAHRVADRAIDLIAGRLSGAARPALLTVSFDEPHGPYICPPPFRGRFAQSAIYRPPTFMADLSGKPRLQQDYAAFLAKHRPTPETFPGYYHRYYDCNSYVDYEIGRVLDAIAAHLPPDTVVIFTSDHGDHLGAFGLCAKGPTMYDHTIAVPLIVKAPGLTTGGQRAPGVVSTLDIMPTILELAGVALDTLPDSDEVHGFTERSLLPVLQQPETRIHGAVFVEYNRFGTHFDQVNGLYPIRCIRTEDWKLSINLFDTDELYNLREDPHEAANRIDDPAAALIRDELHDRLLDWQRRTQDVLRGPQWGARAWRPDFAHEFRGLFTTGYADTWEFGALANHWNGESSHE